MKTYLLRLVIIFLLISVCKSLGQESLFPRITGWKVIVEEQVYDPNNLWDIIDGAADLYLEYSFVDLHIARYTNENNIEVKAELYRHKDSQNAFGIYSQERDPKYNFIQIGVQGYQQPAVLNFLDGEFYIKLTAYQTDKAAEDALLLIAKQIDEQLNKEKSLPKILQCLPSKGRELNSEQYVAQNFLGYSFLKSVYTAVYSHAKPFKAFILEAKSSGIISKALNDYFAAIPKNNCKKIGSDRYEVNDPNNGPITFAVLGNYIYGMLNCTDDKLLEENLSEMKKNLSGL